MDKKSIRKIAIFSTCLFAICFSAWTINFIANRSYDSKAKESMSTKTPIEQSLSRNKDNDILKLKFNSKIITVEIALTETKREEGLMNRTSLPENSGMLFIFPDESQRTFWMKNTLISLDIIYLDSSFRVMSIQKYTKVDQTIEVYPSILPAQYVLELNAGWSDINALKSGDYISVDSSRANE